MNSNLLREAIADAKAVRATALANAKAALEEAFNQRFSAVFADKLREDSDIGSLSPEDPTVEIDSQLPVAETVNKDPVGSTKSSKSDGTKSWLDGNTDPSAKPTTKDITPSTIPAAKDGGDGTKGWSKDNKGGIDGTPKGIEEDTTEVDLDEMVPNEDLEEILRELEAEAGGDDKNVAGGDQSPAPSDLPPTDNATDTAPEPDASGEPLKAGDTVTLVKASEVPETPEVPEAPETPEVPSTPGGEPTPPVEEEEIDLNELLASLNEEAKEEKCDESVLKNQLSEITSQRDDAYKTVEYLRSQINEINLLNAKLLYTNKLFKEFSMNRDQKTKVVEAFDLTKNVREVKMTYANWCESLNLGGNLKRKPMTTIKGDQITTITEGAASKVVTSTKPSKEVITESGNEMAQRFKKLAGIPVKK